MAMVAFASRTASCSLSEAAIDGRKRQTNAEAMQHPLDSAKFKIVWANEHLKALKAELRRYLDPHPYKLTTYTAKDGQDYPDVVTTAEPDMSISAIIGDCLCCARAPLDYIAWELATKHFQDPAISDKDRKWVSFPISTSPSGTPGNGLDSKLNGFLKRKMPTAVIDEIKLLQPYNRGYESLGWLNELINTDKHRMPHLTIGAAGTFMYIQFGPHRLFPAFGHDLDTESGVSGDDVKVDAQIPVYVAFKNAAVPDRSVHELIAEIIKTVADVIPRFDRFF